MVFPCAGHPSDSVGPIYELFIKANNNSLKNIMLSQKDLQNKIYGNFFGDQNPNFSLYRK